jgi:catechol 2,3-dioxygenase-like lactoylglutathione lyase family enzyme
VQVDRLDHLVLTVKDIDATVDFYTSILGMDKVMFGDGRIALSFGAQKINLHQLDNQVEPKATNVQPGSADLCLVINQPIEQAIRYLIASDVSIIEGPVARTGAMGSIISAYFRDPDGNLIEVSNYEI